MGFLDDIESELQDIVSGEFSQDVVITAGSLSWTVGGIFDRTFLAVDENGLTIQSRQSQVGIYIAEIDEELGHELSEDDDPEIEIAGITYYVAEVQRDGTGFASIRLKRAA